MVEEPSPQTPSEMGRKGGRARQARLTPEQRSALGRKASAARWAKWRAEHPEPPVE
mgnify:CR=1 FL=1